MFLKKEGNSSVSTLSALDSILCLCYNNIVKQSLLQLCPINPKKMFTQKVKQISFKKALFLLTRFYFNAIIIL